VSHIPVKKPREKQQATVLTSSEFTENKQKLKDVNAQREEENKIPQQIIHEENKEAKSWSVQGGYMKSVQFMQTNERTSVMYEKGK